MKIWDGTFHESNGNGPLISYERLVTNGNLYLCWNSFKSCWYWGKRDLSERLSTEQAEKLASIHGGKIVERKFSE